MGHLGHMYANGLGVAASNKTAKHWFQKAANLGHPSGLYGLGYMHLKGQGMPVDHAQAFKHFSAATEKVRQAVSCPPASEVCLACGAAETCRLSVCQLRGKSGEATVLHFAALCADTGHGRCR